MKNLFRCTFPAIIFILGFSCAKNESIKTGDKCAQAKLIQQWCPDPSNLAVIKILSNKSMGGEWTLGGKTNQNVILAQLDSTLIKYGKDWNKVTGSSDSVFYFYYVSKQTQDVLVCKLCCPPTETILITSIITTPCPIVVDK